MCHKHISHIVVITERQVLKLKAITTKFETATDDAIFDQGTKALKKVEDLLLKGKKLESKDKAYAGFTNGVRLGMKRGHALRCVGGSTRAPSAI